MADIVAIGASQGGVHALRTLVEALPKCFRTPVLVVLHIGAARSFLPSLLNERDGAGASHAADGELIRAGHIFIAPPDHHMLVADGRIRLSRGPRENWARPAIDPLFRSVAKNYGAGAIGVILSGALNDGTAGLYDIKRCGGTAIVQDPADAEIPSMPQSAVQNVSGDYCLPLSEIAPLLARLDKRRESKISTSTGVFAMSETAQKFAIPVAQTCPECGGAMREEQRGTITQFRCHIGHVMTAEILAATKLERLQNDIAVCVRAANEHAELCREIARKHQARGDSSIAETWRQAAGEAGTRAQLLEQWAEKDWMHPDNAPAAVAAS
jgi:two-component system chemotaxis response regulator CheB